MAIDDERVRLLREAFTQFSRTSHDLERSYRRLQGQVRELRAELAAKNRALTTSLAEQEALRDQAARNHRLAAVGEMAARMAHELRNPLGSIELFAALLRRQLADRPEQRQWAEHVSTAVAAMDYVLSNLLLFTRPPRPRRRRVDLAPLVESARRFAIHRLEQNQVVFECDLTAVAGPAWCDPDLLRQALVNLILNAIDAMPHGGRLTVTAAARAGGVEIAVQDTGVGIPATALAHIFDPFFTTKGQGTGLGLAIAHNALEAHGGAIRVESPGDRGARFTLWLPPEPVRRSMEVNACSP